MAKMTLYNHFASKDDLILAVLQYREEQVLDLFRTSIDRYHNNGISRLSAFFMTLKDWFQEPGFRGCSFINASVELANASHPGSVFSAAHKERFHGLITAVLSETVGEKVAEQIGPAVGLLVEGSIIESVMQQTSKPADDARLATQVLIEATRKS